MSADPVIDKNAGSQRVATEERDQTLRSKRRSSDTRCIHCDSDSDKLKVNWVNGL
jgi:hypothetical protein